MLDRLRDLFGQLAGPRETLSPDDDPRVAVAALLFHVINADGVMEQPELDRLRALLREEYGLDAAEAERIAAAGEQADREAVDLFRFTRVLSAHFDEDQRVRFVELLWDVTYADGSLHELEDNLIWRIAELLGVSARDRMIGKRGAQARILDR